jgi:dTDP-4-amino-4,6-dideoxygalactose transaminase
MTDLAAALGLPQLRKQEGGWRRRADIARCYDEALAGLPVHVQPRATAEGHGRHSLHVYVLMLDAERWQVGRDRVVEALRAENIGAAVCGRPLHGLADEALPHAASVGRTLLTLPISPAMTERDVDDVIRAFRKVAAAFT